MDDLQAKAEEILKEYQERWLRDSSRPMVLLLNEIAKELYGEQFTFKIVQQIHDEYVVEVSRANRQS